MGSRYCCMVPPYLAADDASSGPDMGGMPPFDAVWRAPLSGGVLTLAMGRGDAYIQRCRGYPAMAINAVFTSLTGPGGQYPRASTIKPIPGRRPGGPDQWGRNRNRTDERRVGEDGVSTNK